MRQHAWQWQAQHSGTDASFRGISAVSGSVAWASGTAGTVLRTTDGGKHWQRLPVPGAEALDFRDIHAFSAQEAVVLSIGPGEKSRLYKTTDGGAHWRCCFTNDNPKAFYDGLAFWNRKVGIALSDAIEGRFPLLMTTDGEHWEPLTPQSLPAALPQEAAFAASGTCLAVWGQQHVWFATGGPAARVFRSTDRGRHWEVAATPLLCGKDSQGIFSIAFSSERHGVVVGGDYSNPTAAERTAAYTDDGGKTWQLAPACPGGFRSAVAQVPSPGSATWIAVGTTGSDISEDGGRTWKPLGTGNDNALALTAGSVGWSVGPKGRIAQLGPAKGFSRIT